MHKAAYKTALKSLQKFYRERQREVSMGGQFTLGVLAFIFVFSVFYFVNNSPSYEIKFPYIYGDALAPAQEGQPTQFFSLRGLLVSYAFVFAASLLFFGYGAAIALGFEAAKYAQLYIAQQIHAYELVFLLPEFLAAYAAVMLAGAALEEAKSGVNPLHNLGKAIALFTAGLILTVFAFFLRNFVASTQA